MMRKKLSGARAGRGTPARGAPGDGRSQNSRTATGNANARIITAISITKLVDLRFGDIVPGAGAGHGR